ncbi:hypothetical protein KFL_001460095, partial [Klebsormidium nitens]
MGPDRRMPLFLAGLLLLSVTCGHVSAQICPRCSLNVENLLIHNSCFPERDGKRLLFRPRPRPGPSRPRPEPPRPRPEPPRPRPEPPRPPPEPPRPPPEPPRPRPEPPDPTGTTRPHRTTRPRPDSARPRPNA